jgi:hypothetical protein
MKKVIIDIETSFAWPPNRESLLNVDMLNKKCSCGKGEYHPMLRDDAHSWNPILECNVCDKVTYRYITKSDYREKQINKILQ